MVREKERNKYILWGGGGVILIFSLKRKKGKEKKYRSYSLCKVSYVGF